MPIDAAPLIALTVLAATFAAGTPGAPPAAGALLAEKEATALVGAPLGAVFANEVAPTTENGRDHTTVRGYFPKGYDLETAEGPPERGILLSLHAMPTPEAARRFHDAMRSMTEERLAAPDAPKGVTLADADSLGDVAHVRVAPAPGPPDAGIRVAEVTFVSGRVMGQLTVWSKRDAAAIARRAAREVCAKLH
jgi:hypothetical protein